MKILAIDVGNTNVVIGVCEVDRQNSRVDFSERFSTMKNATDIEYAVLFQTCFSLNNLEIKQIEGAIISSVVPELTRTIQTVVKRLIGKEAIIVGPGIKTGLNIKIDNPAQLGSDRVLDAVASLTKYKPPIAVVDMGTATTISVIDKTKAHLGGMIIPGLKVSLNALCNMTSQLPKVSLEPPKNLIGANTIDCMKSGILYGTASMIEGMIDRIEKELGESVNAVITGGNSELVVKFIRRKVFHEPDLMLIGLMEIYRKTLED